MKFACLGWGSLIWCSKALPIIGQWRPDGPALPIEFARESRDKRITLVVCQEVSVVTTLWAYLDVATLAEAKNTLATREDIPEKSIKHSIGFWSPRDVSGGPYANLVGEWAVNRSIKGVVWTALKPKFGRAHRMPKIEEVIAHLHSLEGAEKDAAEEYVRLAPRQIATVYRSEIEREFGWIPNGLV
jgi:hypothetical protein